MVILFAWFSTDSIGFITVNCWAAFCKYYIIYEHQSYRSRESISEKCLIQNNLTVSQQKVSVLSILKSGFLKHVFLPNGWNLEEFDACYFLKISKYIYFIL